MPSNKYTTYIVGFLGGIASIEGSSGVFAIQNGFIGLAGAIMFVQLILFFDTWKKFTIALGVLTYAASIICGHRFFSFLCGYLLFVLFGIVVVASCIYNKKSIYLEYDFVKKELQK